MFDHINEQHPLTGQIQAHKLKANIAFGIMYALLDLLAMVTARHHGHFISIWFSTGFAMCGVLLAGRSLLPGLFFASLCSHLIWGYGAMASVFISAGCYLEAYVAYGLLKPARKLSALMGRYTMFAWIVSTALIAPIIAAFLGTFASCFLKIGAVGIWLSEVWRIWYISDTVSIIVITPLALLIQPVRPTIEQCFKLIAFTALSTIVYILVFNGGPNNPAIFLAFPLVLIGCIWFGAAGCTYSVILFTLFATLIDYHKAGLAGNPSDYILLFDIFLVVLGITAMALGSFYKKERFWVPSLILLTGWLISAWLFHALHKASDRIDDVRLTELITDAESAILNRYNNYVDSLKAGAGFHLQSEEVTHKEWKNFVRYLELQERYPGINGLGLIVPLHSDELDSYLKDKQSNYREDFGLIRMTSTSHNDLDRLGYAHYIVDRIEPVESNMDILGLDISTQSMLREAAAASRDSGHPTVSNSILINHAQNQAYAMETGFFLFLPMYQDGLPLDSIDERRDAFIAWTFAPFLTHAFFDSIAEQKADKLKFAIFDGEQVSPENLVYQTDSEWNPLQNLDFERQTKLPFGDKRYSIAWKRGEGFNSAEVYSATIAAASLALGTCFLAGIVVSLQTTNRSANRIVEMRTAELREVNETLLAEVQDRKNAEESAKAAMQTAEAANLAKSEFLATMSHEIRTPMNSVLGFSELLYGSNLTGEQRLWTSYIRGSGQSLLAIINDILDFSKIEAGKMELERIPFSPDKSIEEVVGSFYATANEKGLQLDLDIDENLPERIIGDPIRFKQILTNLVGNAIKFTEKGGVRIHSHWEANEKDEGVLHLRVEDSGVGISPDKLNSLFEKFTQVDSSTTRKFGGTGLGLAICKRLITLMGGQIAAESEVDKGTCMRLSIPVKVSEQSAYQSHTAFKEAKSEEPKESFSAEVMLVDDNAVNRKLGMTILQRMGCRVTLACDGQEAIEAAKINNFSIIFMDCRMPVMDGFDATRKIRELEAQGIIQSDTPGKHIPILALTANVTSDNRQECLDAGMDDHLRKPCKISDFKTALRTYWKV